MVSYVLGLEGNLDRCMTRDLRRGEYKPRKGLFAATHAQECVARNTMCAMVFVSYGQDAYRYTGIGAIRVSFLGYNK